MSPARRIRRELRSLPSATAAARGAPRQVDDTAGGGIRLPPAPQLEEIARFPPR